MKLPKRNTKLYSHLHQSGILESNDEQLIKDAIKSYYRNYDKELQNRKRKIEKRQFSISFSMQHINHIRKRAKDYGMNVVDYLKVLVKADLSNSSPFEQTLVYKELLQTLRQYKNSLDALEAKESNRLFGNNNYNELRKILESIQDEIEIKKK